MENIDNYRGFFSKDMLLKKINSNESIIIYLQSNFDGGGIHWIFVYNDSNSDSVEYFDSFGLVPPNEIVTDMNTSSKNIIYNDSQIQHINSIMCGYYCIYYLLQRYESNRKPGDILLDFHDFPSLFNERFIEYFTNFI